ncbi:rab11 family-interacting protein 2-like [Paramacrobiotus metropolitanus]|uniref:rab11 family-interacting protein 2-like n=1 Tax=Paramacrobiotus metropolitanus TaxID=2943436 RepID=UPI0024461025|nr:rab11 family-interacting protein 2-like [Paramacrobiotus metropolitanus]
MSHWSPTHVQVTVIRAKNLIPKSKNGETNNAYVTIQLGKEKFETSVQEKSKSPEWNEECDLRIADLTGSIVLTAYHKHTIGTDDFLGRVELPLQDLNFYERPKNIWFPLRSKKKDSNKEEKYRGEIQVRLNFYVQNLAVSVPNLLENGGKKERSSFRSTLSNTFGKTLPNRKHHGSVMDISTSSPKSSGGLFSSLSRSHSKTHLASQTSTPADSGYGSYGSKPQLTPELSANRSIVSEKLSDDVSFTSSNAEIREPEIVVTQPESVAATTAPVTKSSSFNKAKSIVNSVIYSTNGSSNTLPRTPSEVEIKPDYSKSYNKSSSMTVETNKRNSTLSDTSEKSPRLNGDIFAKHQPRFTEPAEPVTPTSIHVSKEMMRKYGHLEKADLIARLVDAEQRLGEKQTEIDRMQTYIESLLLRVMDTAPKLLQTYPADGTPVRR